MANNHVKKTIIKRRCDKPMKRSKERTKWKCDKDCRNCFCCIEMDNDGYEEHVDIRRVRKDERLPKDKE